MIRHLHEPARRSRAAAACRLLTAWLGIAALLAAGGLRGEQPAAETEPVPAAAESAAEEAAPAEQPSAEPVPDAPAETEAESAGQEQPATEPAEEPAKQTEEPAEQPAEKQAPAIVSLEVYPRQARLQTNADRQSFVVLATREDDITLDVTDQAQWTLGDGSLVRVEGAVLYPAADGETTLTVAFAGHESSMQIEVRDADTERPVSFHLDLMAVLTRSGCNSGGCHGAARGKDGFMLSLFGYDPLGDYDRITRELGTRRINLALPERSLLIEKATGQVPHTGGQLFGTDSEYYRIMHSWLQAGATLDSGELPVCEKLEIFPPAAVLEGEGTTQQFIALAHYNDGTTRDVTSLTVFSTNNDNSAPIDEYGLVTAAAQGEAFVMARFDTHTVGSQVIVLPHDLEYTPPPQAGNYIDEFVLDKLNKLRIDPSPLCSDEDFLRRVTIDITGQLPTIEEYDAFMADDSPDKRSRVIDELLERKEFAEIWAMKWAELLMIRSDNNRLSTKSVHLYSNWVTDQVSNNVPLDEMVRQMLSAGGGTFSNPESNFYEVERNALQISENVAQVFMGIRTQCAQCHNHPFDRWTMDDYYSFAAFFGQIGRKQAEDYRESIIFNRGNGNVNHPVSNQVMEPKFLGGVRPEIERGEDRREVLAAWLTSEENPFFATSVANRVWAHFFGMGIVEPVDDIRVSNPPSNPELFEALGARLIEVNYDFKALVRDICNSHTYQRTATPTPGNAHDTRNFARAEVRRIPAELLLDCLVQVTGDPDKFRGLPLGSRAVQIADGRTGNYFLTTFGRSERTTVCACESTIDPTLSQALHLLNGETVSQKIARGGTLRTWLEAELSPEDIIENIFVAALTRMPTDEERAAMLETLEQAPAPREGYEDVFWAVLNSREFLFNH